MNALYSVSILILCSIAALTKCGDDESNTEIACTTSVYDTKEYENLFNGENVQEHYSVVSVLNKIYEKYFKPRNISKKSKEWEFCKNYIWSISFVGCTEHEDKDIVHGIPQQIDDDDLPTIYDRADFYANIMQMTSIDPDMHTKSTPNKHSIAMKYAHIPGYTVRKISTENTATATWTEGEKAKFAAYIDTILNLSDDDVEKVITYAFRQYRERDILSDDQIQEAFAYACSPEGKAALQIKKDRVKTEYEPDPEKRAVLTHKQEEYERYRGIATTYTSTIKGINAILDTNLTESEIKAKISLPTPPTVPVAQVRASKFIRDVLENDKFFNSKTNQSFLEDTRYQVESISFA